MSQILIGRPKERVLYSDLHFPKHAIILKSQASEVACYVCGSTLKEGNSLSARQVKGKVVFVCDNHL